MEKREIIMDLKQYLNNNEDLPLLKQFSTLGKSSDFNKKLNFLITIAEPEKWNQLDIITGYDNSIMFYYIIHTFDRCFNQEKIFISPSEDDAFFNTGLMDTQGNEIFGHFVKSFFYDPKNKNENYWYLKDFMKQNDRNFIALCDKNPETATYFEDYNELYFDPKIEINLNFDHFYDDNFDRLPNSLTQLEKNIALMVFEGFLKHTIKRIKRNNRIPVPQFYNGKISFLIPIKVFNEEIVVIAVEKINNQYRGNTVLSMGMAYNCARLLNKPESNWLLLK